MQGYQSHSFLKNAPKLFQLSVEMAVEEQITKNKLFPSSHKHLLFLQ